jgi:outer membrane protein
MISKKETMMKISKVGITVFIFFIFTLNCMFAGAEEIKIGYVNLGKTFDEYEKTKKYDKSLEEKGSKKEKARQKLVDEIKELKDEMVLLSDKGKEDKQSNIDEKIKSLQEFDKETRDELRQERDEMVRDILREIDAVIQDYGKEKGYTVILNDRMLVYGNEAIEVTQDIIDILNKKKQ